MTTTGWSHLVESYPETNPYEFEPGHWNLVPMEFHKREDDLPEFIAGCLAQAEKDLINPVRLMYGVNPFMLLDEVLSKAHLPLTSYKPPPPLPQYILHHSIVILEDVNPTGNTPVFKVQIGANTYLLKLFPDRDSDPDEPADFDFVREKDHTQGLSMRRFQHEKDAYEHLLHFGTCDTGAVPYCYGWIDGLPLSDIAGLPDHWVSELKNDLRPPKAIVLEYLANAERLTIHNITIPLGVNMVKALYAVHKAYVMHCDCVRRNILVLPSSGRVVWVDFDNARTALDVRLRRQDLLNELAAAWNSSFETLLPDRRIGFVNPYW